MFEVSVSAVVIGRKVAFMLLLAAGFAGVPELARADHAGPEAVISNYVKACYTGDVALLKSLFHAEALMTGHSKRGFYLGSPEPFFANVAGQEPMSKTEAAYEGRITTVQVSGDIAAVTLEETGYFGRSYTDVFTLAKLDGEWKIVSKTYYQSQ
ncbi:MAG: nuclear transport factor 2 family protein [Pseudomonadota bacterium]